jgi:hypothetical protein
MNLMVEILHVQERKQQKKEPVSIFEHFVVVGLHPNSNVAATEAAFAKKKTWQRSVEKAEHLSGEVLKFKGPPVPALEAQLLFKYPLGKGLPLKTKELPDFCFPSGVEVIGLHVLLSFTLIYGTCVLHFLSKCLPAIS